MSDETKRLCECEQCNAHGDGSCLPARWAADNGWQRPLCTGLGIYHKGGLILEVNNESLWSVRGGNSHISISTLWAGFDEFDEEIGNAVASVQAAVDKVFKQYPYTTGSPVQAGELEAGVIYLVAHIPDKRYLLTELDERIDGELFVPGSVVGNDSIYDYIYSGWTFHRFLDPAQTEEMVKREVDSFAQSVISHCCHEPSVVRVCEGGGPEDPQKTLSVSVLKMKNSIFSLQEEMAMYAMLKGIRDARIATLESQVNGYVPPDTVAVIEEMSAEELANHFHRSLATIRSQRERIAALEAEVTEPKKLADRMTEWASSVESYNLTPKHDEAIEKLEVERDGLKEKLKETEKETNRLINKYQGLNEGYSRVIEGTIEEITYRKGQAMIAKEAKDDLTHLFLLGGE